MMACIPLKHKCNHLYLAKKRGKINIYMKQKGFTIIELIVVIAIIAVLSGIVMVNVTGYLRDARNAKKLIDVKNYIQALELYYSDHSAYPEDEDTCCLGTYSEGITCWAGNPVCGPTNTALKDYISGLPTDTRQISGYAGYLFTNALPYWNGYGFSWMIEGKGPCSLGAITYPDNPNNWVNSQCDYVVNKDTE